MEEQNYPMIPLPGEEDMKQHQQQDENKKLYEVYVNKWSVGLKPTEDYEETYEEQTEILQTARITTKTPQKKPVTLLSIGGVSVIEQEDTYLIKGDPKSGKTTLCKVLIGAILSGNYCNVNAELPDLKVAYIDTEQKFADTQGILNYMRALTGGEVSDEYIDFHFHLYPLRKRDYTQLSKDLLRIVIDFRPDIIICDGIADFVRSFNDEDASRAIVLLQLRIIEEFHCAIINLIHENKAHNDHNAKGHLGQLESQKGAIIISTKKEGEIIHVSSAFSRHKSMPDMYLMYDDHGMICDATETYKTQEKAKKAEESYLKIAQEIINEAGCPVHRTELSKKMSEKTGNSSSWMATTITKLNGKGLYIVNNMVQLTAPEDYET